MAKRKEPKHPPRPWAGDMERVAQALEASGDLCEELGSSLREAIDEVLDTVRTRRWHLDQCEDLEKTYLGFKVEHVIRQRFELPPSRRKLPDFSIAGVDVDCKWSKNMWKWQMPSEAIGTLCLLLHADDDASTFSAGLVLIRNDMLTKGKNKDGKRTIKAAFRGEIGWLCPPGSPLPPNFLLQLSGSDRTAILAPHSGNGRLAELFRRKQGQIIHRATIAAVAGQKDPTRRSRAIKTILESEGIAVLCGYRLQERERAVELGGPALSGPDEWVSLPLPQPTEGDD